MLLSCFCAASILGSFGFNVARYNQLPEILKVLREFRDEGAVVNINCKMGKNRSGVAVLLWLVCEAKWGTLPETVDHLRKINFMALGNPVLLMAVVKYLEVDPNSVTMLPPSGDGIGKFLYSLG